MNIALWIVAWILAIGYVAGGIVKLTWSHEKYAAKLHRARDFTPGNVKFMGVIEKLGGLGLADDLHLVAPIFLGRGHRLWGDPRISHLAGIQ